MLFADLKCLWFYFNLSYCCIKILKGKRVPYRNCDWKSLVIKQIQSPSVAIRWTIKVNKSGNLNTVDWCSRSAALYQQLEYLKSLNLFPYILQRLYRYVLESVCTKWEEVGKSEDCQNRHFMKLFWHQHLLKTPHMSWRLPIACSCGVTSSTGFADHQCLKHGGWDKIKQELPVHENDPQVHSMSRY